MTDDPRDQGGPTEVVETEGGELIERLSTEQRQVLTLKFLFGFANAEAATILDKTEGAVKSLQHRALVSLQKQIAGAAPDEES